MWGIWWVWFAAALALAFLEVLAPAWVFLGFAIGAAATGVLLGIGGPLAAWMTGSLPATLLIFAVLSLVAWLMLRKVMGVRQGQIKVWNRDINED